MVKGPYSHGKTPEEVAREVRVHMTRICRRRQRFQTADQHALHDVRRRIAEAVAAGISAEEAAAVTGYKFQTVARWLVKRRSAVRAVPVERAREHLDRIRERRRRTAQEELKISARARALVRRAMEVGIEVEEFAEVTGYSLKTVNRWFDGVRRSLERAQRQREIASARRGKRRRPPQHLSPAERDRWLAEAERRRKWVLQRHGLRTGAPARQLRKPSIGGAKRHRKRRQK
ncbi:hypothetical protein GCM10010348_76580 [Streptomyces anthocyanicus]|nr:hypothetical protein GCM10010348_76580 [Streptomyces anthocyanicus]